MSLLQSTNDPSICSRCGGDLDFKYEEVSPGVSELTMIYCSHCHITDEEYELEREHMEVEE